MMNWKTFLRKMHKLYSSIWDNIERIKSVFLSVLILLSIFLTWNLWTFTPQTNVLEDQEPFKSAIEEGQKKKLTDIIRPKQIIVHQNGTNYWAYAQSQKKLYNALQSELLNISDNANHRHKTPDYGLSIIYPTPIPIEVLKETFNFSGESSRAQLSGDKVVEKVLVFLEDDRWKLQIELQNAIDKDQGQTEPPSDGEPEKSKTTVEFQLPKNTDLGKTIDDLMNDEMSTIHEVKRVDDIQDKTYYWPVNDMKVQSYIVPTNTLDIDLFVKALLPPDVVSKTSNDTGTTLFLRQRSQIKYFETREEFTYINNQYTQGEVIRQNTIIQSLDFINNHAGWTFDYYMEHYYDAEVDKDTNTKQKDLTYRMLMDGFPVIDELPGSNSMGNMLLEVTNNQVTKYSRSLKYPEEYQLPSDMISIPDAASVEKALQRLEETYPNIRINDVMLGYKALQSDEGYRLIPTWYYKGTSSWVEIDFKKDESPTNKGG